MMQKTYNEIFEATYSVEQTKNLQENPSTSSDLFNMTDIFIRRLIKFAKCIPEFKELKQEDQINLLKVCVLGFPSLGNVETGMFAVRPSRTLSRGGVFHQNKGSENNHISDENMIMIMNICSTC